MHATCTITAAPRWHDDCSAATELRRAAGYPIARWYLRPAAGWLAAKLTRTPVRPVHLTLLGLASALAAMAVLICQAQPVPLAPALVLLYWFFDRADGQLARRQRTVSALGAWLDANVDELADVGLHAAVAAVLGHQTGAAWPWWVLAAMLSGKYLFMYGLAMEEHVRSPHHDAASGPAAAPPPWTTHALGRLYHFPGNADVRIHLLAVALFTDCLAAELVFVAAYYNFRWIARYALVARRLGGAP